MSNKQQQSDQLFKKEITDQESDYLLAKFPKQIQPATKDVKEISPKTVASLTETTKSNTSPNKRKTDSTKTVKPTTRKRRKRSTASSSQQINNSSNDNNDDDDDNDNKNKNGSHASAGHRPVTSCTHCRQHKIKCNASEKFPDPCSRCQRMNLKCEIDPQFRPKKGSQIQSLRNDVDELRSKIEFLTKNENLIAKVLHKTAPNQLKSINENSDFLSQTEQNDPSSPTLVVKTHLKKEPVLLSLDGRSNSTALLNDSASNKADLNPALEAAIRSATESPAHFEASHGDTDDSTNKNQSKGTKLTTPVNTKSISQNILSPNTQISEFILGDVKLSLEKAKTLHKLFVSNYLPYLPIMVSNDPIELYQQSQLLFWTIMLTACLSDPEPNLYNSFASLIKQLAIETCWIRTPRSTHIVQSLLILGTWPLPNQKVLDDCSYRFIGLAKSLSLQLGLHRGKFMTEFSRTQVALPDAEKWRSRTWLAVFFCEQFWSSNLGLPPSLQTDYLLESARIDSTLPKNFRCLISLAIFQAKLVNIMGLNVSSPDGLMDPANRAGPLHIMERELERLVFKLQIDDLVVEIYYLYVKLMVCLFSFLPETPSEDQTKYVTTAYLSATRIVTIMSKLLEKKQLTEYPIYVRHSVTTAAFVLFRLHLTPYLLPKYIDSSRQSIVTVHRLFRNMLAAWKDVENDISRTATVLEKLNFVIITHPELFTDTEGIIVRMRSHLTGSLFYDLVWNIHEARRRTIEEAKNNISNTPSVKNKNLNNKKRPLPLPFYNQITKDDFTAITTTTPNGTTITTLVPTDQAISNAKASAYKAGLSKPTEINGIPLAMLEATGSLSSKIASDNGYTLKPQSLSQMSSAAATRAANNKTSKNTVASTTKTQQPRKRKSSTKKAIAQSSLQEESNSTINNITSSKIQKGLSFEEGGVKLQRSTSMNAAANGLVPPPLFPTLKNFKRVENNNSINTVNDVNNTSNGDFSSGFKTQYGNNNISHSSPLTTTLDSRQNTGLTPVSISGLDKLFESPTMPVSDVTPSESGNYDQLQQQQQQQKQDQQQIKQQQIQQIQQQQQQQQQQLPQSPLPLQLPEQQQMKPLLPQSQPPTPQINVANSNGSNLSNTNNKFNTTGSTSQSPTDSDLLNEMFIDSIFQQNLSKPAEDDDLLGWFDMNMAPEF
ncbi:suppressor protein sef1 [Pichia californica]|uniref:Suppressor protein sef1 n=1 Tax=Pichia californica TaxID=460514 RepID=A0A9P6WMX3_9ASCO|nr:suppressor protein sef1 [[Candida] californica]KAG0690075.1 suppressor protein sef1 [[Candida] californica]